MVFRSLSILCASEMGEGASHDGSDIYKVSGTHHLGPDSWVIVA
jgi:hypothetical protein